MNLFSQTIRACRWVGGVTRTFFRVRPWTTTALVLSIALAKIAHLLAFFLPLKVILLAGSDGVPRYFRFFIEPDEKMPWIIGLSAGAVAFYILSLALDAISRRLSEAGSLDVLEGANELAVASQQREQALGYFERFSDISANALIVVIGFSVLGLFNPLLLFVLIVLIALQYLFTATVIHQGNPMDPGWVYRSIQHSLPTYLTIFSSANFLVGFFIILIPFLLGDGGNLLFAILSILLLRQALGAIAATAALLTSLWKQKPQIDPLVYRTQKIQSLEKANRTAVRQVFDRSYRTLLARDKLRQAGFPISQLKSEWQDPTFKVAYLFKLGCKTQEPKQKELNFQQQVFPRNRLHLLEHEHFLFEHVSREALSAPSLLAYFKEGGFTCQILDYGLARGMGAAAWRDNSVDLMLGHWAYAPPRKLVSAFNSARPTIEERLDEAFLSRLDVALDTPAARAGHGELLGKLDKLRDALESIPVYIHNPDFVRKNCVLEGSGSLFVMTWCGWTIEPIGATLFRAHSRDRLESILPIIRHRRNLPQDALTVSHVLLANECCQFESLIKRGRYGAAVQRIPRILKNELMA